MEKRRLGRTDLQVSAICLGTMTWGEQNSEAEGHQQMDYALAEGVNFFDTAELYPIAPRRETQGRTEQIIGSWFKARGNRSEVILATKMVGLSVMDWFREDGSTGLPNRSQVVEAVEASLIRLQSDYIDLYQLHWPGRPVSQFGANPVLYKHGEGEEVAILETLEAFDELIKAGKLRHIGVSNESAWGAMQWLHLAEKHGLAPIASIQNAYSMVNRTYETALAEISLRENVSLLAYSPLAQGYLSGKYRNGARPEGARRTLFDRLQRYETPGAAAAIEACLALAEARGLDASQMAIRFVTAQPFVTSCIIGATNMEQLKNNISAQQLDFDQGLSAAIDALQRLHTNPCP